ncbi:ParB/RepB/Spo0J family partition protein [Novosphingobium sp. FSY-8]|uniref:ParB/RepB/Spo0J family partition protein n=1 Tax=Novosphingobium ovatum TaxID=1908523 RepID=A0ABW9XHD5_9SPHN|nr:ParB/RepB/Spo0J family partition protein [Novosphingobium ovatum]NBC37965.1 ParB/RepB/Spo0J family partition protein [Novosphingobium ovatum]
MSDETTARPAARRKPPALGRGLSALLGETRREEPVLPPPPGGGVAAAPAMPLRSEVAPRVGGMAQLAVADITPDPDQPRRHFDDSALDELAASIAARGVIQPIIVRPKGTGYMLVAGERRWRAAQRAQLHEIPALIRDLTDREVMALALIENLQREDLNPIEEARAYQRLAESESMTQADIAKMVDKSRSHVANIQRLLSLPEAVIRMVEEAELSMGHARALIGCDAAETLAAQAVAKGWSVREIEQQVRRSAGREAPVRRQARQDTSSPESADIQMMQQQLEECLGLSVKIHADADPRSGAVTIRYTTLDQLDLISSRLTGGGGI